MKEIPLTRGLIALVDDEDYEELSQYKWQADGDGYATRNISHPTIPGKTIHLSMHRYLLGLEYGDPRKGDHKDTDRRNNRRGNLRICTVAQNVRNSGLRRDNTSGLKGVSWVNKYQKWIARIANQGQKIHLGYFDDPDKAYAAYCKAALELHGEFANLGRPVADDNHVRDAVRANQ